jgi:hypothetical protein
MTLEKILFSVLNPGIGEECRPGMRAKGRKLKETGSNHRFCRVQGWGEYRINERDIDAD